jgi:hypothetical protein
MAGRGAQYQCDNCGKTFCRLCHFIQYTAYFQCTAKKGILHDEDDNYDTEIFDDEEIIPKQYSKDREEKMRRTKIMNTPSLHETEISGAKRRLREMLNMKNAEELPKNATLVNNMHLYNPPSLSELKFEAMLADKVEDDCMRAPRILPKAVNVNLTPSLKAQIHLANILSSHNADLSLFNDITSWVKIHSEPERGVNWEGSEWMRRDKLLYNMESILQTEGMRPQQKTVHLTSDNTLISVPVFDFTAMALSMLHDNSLMKEDNIIPNFDLHS